MEEYIVVISGWIDEDPVQVLKTLRRPVTTTLLSSTVRAMLHIERGGRSNYYDFLMARVISCDGSDLDRKLGEKLSWDRRWFFSGEAAGAKLLRDGYICV